MIGRIIGATLGKKAADAVGSRVGGPMGAAIGFGLASRRFRGAALGGLAVMGGLALYKRLRADRPSDDYRYVDERADNGMAANVVVDKNATIDAAHAPRAAQ